MFYSLNKIDKMFTAIVNRINNHIHIHVTLFNGVIYVFRDPIKNYNSIKIILSID